MLFQTLLKNYIWNLNFLGTYIQACNILAYIWVTYNKYFIRVLSWYHILNIFRWYRKQYLFCFFSVETTNGTDSVKKNFCCRHYEWRNNECTGISSFYCEFLNSIDKKCFVCFSINFSREAQHSPLELRINILLTANKELIPLFMSAGIMVTYTLMLVWWIMYFQISLDMG